MVYIFFIFVFISLGPALPHLQLQALDKQQKELPQSTQSLLKAKFKTYSVYALPENWQEGIGNSEIFQLQLNLGNEKNWLLELKQRELRSPNYLIRRFNYGGVQIQSYSSQLKNYIVRSQVSNIKGRLSINKGTLSGFIKDDNARFFMEPVRQFDGTSDPSWIILYDSRDIVATETRCLYENQPDHLLPLAKISESQLKRNKPMACMRTQVAFAVDFTMIDFYGSNEEAESRILTVMNAAEGLYEDPRIDITYEITEMFFEEVDQNTWGQELNFSQNLDNLTTWADGPNGFSNEYDIAGMWFHNLGNGTTGFANIGAVCSKSRGGHIIRDYVRSLGELVVDQAHEFGHNWDAQHINNTQYIMNPIIFGDNMEWSNQTINSIVNHKNSRTCLSGCDVPPVSDFSLDQHKICKSQVSFLDRSRNSPAGWEWDFGDGQKSTEQNPIHQYDNNGTFNVTLKVTNPFGEDTFTRQGYVEINAPSAPFLSANHCSISEVTLEANALYGNIKWYSQATGGIPQYIGPSWTFPLPNQATKVYVENGSPDGAIQRVGPVDSIPGTAGDGDFKDNGTIDMVFDVLNPLRFISLTVFSNQQGDRHFILYHNGSSIKDTVINLPTGTSTINFNWELLETGEYRLELEQSGNYITNLYRNRSGVDYPQTLDNVVSIVRNYYHETSSNNTGWYIGYDWRFQEINPCSSPRLEISVESECQVSVKEFKNLNNKFLNDLGKLQLVEIRNLQGKVIVSMSPEDDFDIFPILKNLPRGNVYWIHVQGEKGQAMKKWDKW